MSRRVLSRERLRGVADVARRRTRESVLDRPERVQGGILGSADFLLLLVDSTRQSSLDELGVVLSLLPVGWWSYTAVVVTKGTYRVGRALGVRKN